MKYEEAHADGTTVIVYRVKGVKGAQYHMVGAIHGGGTADSIPHAKALAEYYARHPKKWDASFRRRNPDPFGRGSANIPVAARFGTGIAGPIVIGGPPVLAPVPDRPIIMSPVDLGGKGGGGGTSGGGSAPGGTASGGGGGSTGTSAPAARANPRRKSARSRAAQSDAKRAMDLFHSGKAKTLAAAWKMVKRGR
jgi:hypothetical protein